MLEDEKSYWLNRSDMAYGRLCLSMSHDIIYEIRNIESPHEIWITLKGLNGDENDQEEHHLEAKRSSYYNSHESGEEDSNNVDKYYEDSVEQEDSSSSIVNEPVVDEHFILSNNMTLHMRKYLSLLVMKTLLSKT